MRNNISWNTLFYKLSAVIKCVSICAIRLYRLIIAKGDYPLFCGFSRYFLVFDWCSCGIFHDCQHTFSSYSDIVSAP